MQITILVEIVSIHIVQKALEVLRISEIIALMSLESEMLVTVATLN